MTAIIIKEEINTDEAAIHTLLNDVATALNKGDIETLLALHTEDIILMEQNMPLLQGKREIKEMFTAFEKRKCPIQITFKTYELEVMGNRAFVRGAVMVTKTENGNDLLYSKGKFICLLSRQADGQWLRSHVIANTDAPV